MKFRRRVCTAGPARRSSGRTRRLRVESLERRQLLASDVVISDTGDPATFVREFDSIGSVATYRPTVLQQGVLPFAQIPASAIQDDLNLGISVVVVTEEAGSTDPGTIQVESNILASGTGAADLKFEADFDVIIAPNVSISSTGLVLNVVLNSDRDQNSSGAVSVENGTTISTNGGNITIGGGSDPTTTPSVGQFSPSSRPGVLVDGQLFSGGGNISIVGAGANLSLPAIEFGPGAELATGGPISFGDILFVATSGTTNLPDLNSGGFSFEAMQVAVFGGLAVGGSNGSFVFEADLNLDSTASLNLDFNGAVSTNFDRLTIDGAVELGGSNLVVNGSAGSAPNQRLRIIDNISTSPTTGTFAGLPEGATVDIGGSNFTISYVAGDGNDVELTNVPTTPSNNFTGTAGDDDYLVRLFSGSFGDEVQVLLNNVLERSFPVGSFTDLTFNTLGGDDSLTIDYGFGDPMPPGGISFDGGTGTNELVSLGGTVVETQYTFDSETSGNVDIDARPIRYSNVQTITDQLIVQRRSMNFSAVNETITLADGVLNDALNEIDSTSGALVRFRQPSSQFSIDAGDGDDIVQVRALSGAGPGNGTATLFLDGGDLFAGDNDQLSLVDVTISTVVNQGAELSNFESITITGGVISGNNGTGDGGGLSIITSPGDNITITGTTFRGNQTAGVGGGLFVDGGNLTLDGVTFDQNIAGDSGGGLYVVNTNTTIRNTTFTSNEARGADSGGGGAYLLGTQSLARTFAIENSDFRLNTSNSGGGGIEIVQMGGTIDGGLFENNRVIGGVLNAEGGGGILILADSLDVSPAIAISGATIRVNQAPSGGGIAAVNPNLTIDRTLIALNTSTATGVGGAGIALTQDSTGGNVVINRSIIELNTSARDAGGIGSLDVSLTINDSIISGNRATSGLGGGIGFTGSAQTPRLRINRATVDNNESTSFGGGIGVVEAVFDLVNVAIDTNSTSSSGGGLFVQSSTNEASSILYSTFSFNSSSIHDNLLVMAGNVSVGATIFADGTSSAQPGSLTSLGSNVESVNSLGLNHASDLVNTNPQLSTRSDRGGLGIGPTGTLKVTARQPGNPALLDASILAPPATDARGISRQQDFDGDGVATADIGAVELTQIRIVSRSVSEDVGTVSVRVELSGLFPEEINTEILNTGNGSATSNVDFTFPATLPLVFPVGSTSLTAEFSIVNDTEIESDETIVLSSIAGLVSQHFVIDNSRNGIITILDDDSSSSLQAANGSRTIDEDSGPASIDLATLVSGGSGSPLTYSILSGPGTLSGSVLTFNPAPNFSGTSIVNYQVTDGATTAEGFVTFIVTPVNDPPIANADTASVAQGGGVEIDVLANDSPGPLETGTLFVLGVSQPSNGSTQLQFNGTILYTPAPGFSGTDSFNYTIGDGPFTASATVTVIVTALGVDFALSKSASSPNVIAGDSLSFTLVASFVSGTTPSSGRVVVIDTLPVGLTLENISAPTATSAMFNASTRQVVIEYLNLSVGQSATAIVNTLVSTTATPLLTNQATVSTLDFSDIDPNNNIASVSIQVLPASPAEVTLRSGAGDGDLSIIVDPMGNFGDAITGLNSYNPVGPALPASAVFASTLAVRTTPSGNREFLNDPAIFVQSNARFSGTGTGDSIVSTFTLLGLNVELTQTVSPIFGAGQQRLGAQLQQTYRVSNPLSVSQTIDLVRYLDGDLAFDGLIDDAGGFVIDANGGLTLFETDRGGNGPVDTTFVGITDGGDGTVPTSDRFMLEDYSDLRSRVRSGTPLLNSVDGDSDFNGFVDSGAEYDIGLALRRLLSIPAFGSAEYTTTTTFGGAPVDTAAVSGHVSCDANGDGLEASDEIAIGATVFIDLNRNGIHESNEPVTVTDSAGNYRFDSLPSGLQVVTLLVPDGCKGLPQRFASVPSSVSIGQLVRDIVVTDLDGDGRNEVLGVGEQNSQLTIVPGDSRLPTRVISVPTRPQAIDVWTTSGTAGVVSTIAVASVAGGPSGRGAVTLIEGSTTRTIPMGNALIDVVLDDFNEDGLPDIVAAAYQSNNYQILLSGSSSNGASGAARVLALGDAAYRVESGDFDGDGHADLALASYGYSNAPGTLQILFGNGDGTFESGPVIELIGKPVALAASEFVSSNSGGGGGGGVASDFLFSSFGDELAVLVNDVTSSAPGSGPQSANPSDARSRVHTYSLSRASASELGSAVVLPAGASSLKAGDTNFDGITDLAVVRSGAATIELLLGNGTGTFIPAKSSIEVSSVINVAFGDLDGSGRDGLVVAGKNNSSSSPAGTTLLKLGVDTVPVTVSGVATRANFSPSTRITRMDVDGNEVIDAVDVVRIINRISQPETRISGESSSGSVLVELDDSLDVNADGQTTALDALLIINHLNQQDSLEATARAQSQAKQLLWAAGSGSSAHRTTLREEDVDRIFHAAGLF